MKVRFLLSCSPNILKYILVLIYLRLNIFPPILQVSYFKLLVGSFSVQHRSLVCYSPTCLILLLLSVLWVSYPRNHCEDHVKNLSPIFSSRAFIVSGLKFKFLVILSYFCQSCKTGVQLFLSLMGCPIFPALFIEETILPSLCVLGILVKNQLSTYEWICVRALFSVLLVVYVLVFVSIILFKLLQICNTA